MRQIYTPLRAVTSDPQGSETYGGTRNKYSDPSPDPELRQTIGVSYSELCTTIALYCIGTSRLPVTCDYQSIFFLQKFIEFI
jgi:hypothetical protein